MRQQKCKCFIAISRVFFKDAFLWFLCDSAIFLQISIFLQNQKVREKTGLKMEEEKNVSKRWCANLIKSSFTSKKIKKVFDFFWLCSSFFEKKFIWIFTIARLARLGAIMMELKNKGETVPESQKKKRVKVVRQPHKIKFYIDKKYINSYLFFDLFFDFFEDFFLPL